MFLKVSEHSNIIDYRPTLVEGLYYYIMINF